MVQRRAHQTSKTDARDILSIPRMIRATRFRAKAPSKRRHERLRTLRRDGVLGQRREERLRLFGYVALKNGEVIGIDEALQRLRWLEREPEQARGIVKDDIIAWHHPETFRDVIDCLGEIDALPSARNFPRSSINRLEDPPSRLRIIRVTAS